MTIEEKLKSLILSRYKSILAFSKESGVAYTTIQSIFTRGIKNSSITSIIKICKKLEISADALANDEIEYERSADEKVLDIQELVFKGRDLTDDLHMVLDGKRLTKEEVDIVLQSLEVAAAIIRRNRL